MNTQNTKIGEPEMIETIAVHQTRNPDDSRILKVVVTREGLHQYDSPGNATQGERAIYAHPVNGGRGKWYVGYGGDYVPATKADIANITIS